MQGEPKKKYTTGGFAQATPKIQTKRPNSQKLLENPPGFYFVNNLQVIVSASDHLRENHVSLETIPSPRIKRRSSKYLLVYHSIHGTAQIKFTHIPKIGFEIKKGCFTQLYEE